MAVKVRPLHDRIIVERLEESEQVVGGIIIPDTAKEKPQQGKVIAAGKGKVKDDGTVTPLDVQAGDKVLCSASTRAKRSSWMAYRVPDYAGGRDPRSRRELGDRKHRRASAIGVIGHG